MHFVKNSSEVNQLEISIGQVSIKKYFYSAILNTCDDIGKKRRHILREALKQYSNILDARFILDRVIHKDSNTSFICSEILAEEQKIFGDLVFLDLPKEHQGFDKLTYKLEKLILHLKIHIDEYRYFFKTDDDTIVRYDNLKSILVSKLDQPLLNDMPNLSQEKLSRMVVAYFGHAFKSKVQKNGRYADRKYIDDTGLDSFPTYMLGAGYGFSNEILKILAMFLSSTSMHKWQNEDATFGHWLSGIKHVKLNLEKQFSVFELCKVGSILYHPVKNITKFELAWQAIRNNSSDTICEILKKK
jgi:hypothetical protein